MQFGTNSHLPQSLSRASAEPSLACRASCRAVVRGSAGVDERRGRARGPSRAMPTTLRHLAPPSAVLLSVCLSSVF